jgi:hypothetical protein
LTPHPSFFTLKPTPSIIHSASFNFHPYSRGWSLTSKKPFLFITVSAENTKDFQIFIFFVSKIGLTGAIAAVQTVVQTQRSV